MTSIRGQRHKKKNCFFVMKSNNGNEFFPASFSRDQLIDLNVTMIGNAFDCFLRINQMENSPFLWPASAPRRRQIRRNEDSPDHPEPWRWPGFRERRPILDAH